MSDTPYNEIVAIADEINPDLVGVRRQLHRNPELGYEEHETSKLIRERLDTLGLTWRDGFGGTGLAAVAGNGPGRTVAIRCDMDALPIHETGNAEYRSLRDGRMHACGHDAHTAIGLGIATVLGRLGDRLPGRALLIFQPAEEGLGGARRMIADGVLDWITPDIVLGFHNWPPLPPGTIGYHPREAFAATDPFDIEIRGISGHGAHPHLAVDPIVAAATLVSALQQIVSREIAPLDAAVLTIGQIEGGTSRSQIPDAVRLKGTLRTQTKAVRDVAMAAISRVCNGVGVANRVGCEPCFLPGTPAVLNDPEVLLPALAVMCSVFGDDNIVELPKGSMGSEDYAEFSTRIPSAHFRIGSKLADRQTMLHRSDFDLDERCIGVAVSAIAAAAFDAMNASSGELVGVAHG